MVAICGNLPISLAHCQKLAHLRLERQHDSEEKGNDENDRGRKPSANGNGTASNNIVEADAVVLESQPLLQNSNETQTQYDGSSTSDPTHKPPSLDVKIKSKVLPPKLTQRSSTSSSQNIQRHAPHAPSPLVEENLVPVAVGKVQFEEPDGVEEEAGSEQGTDTGGEEYIPGEAEYLKSKLW